MDCLFLVRNGVPFDVAFCLAAEERRAWVVALGTLDGGVFDFDRNAWEVPGWTSSGTRAR